MRTWILVIFLIAVVAFVLTDPRWTGKLATPISFSWESSGLMTTASYGTSSLSRMERMSAEERCAFAGRWLSDRQKEGALLHSAELAAVERVMASCRR
ncbi:MAG TPA: hypothetical protein VKY54_14735 [Kiloniellales bacterium]|nr:hypothetical protein [Kiloniellales bacterium]